MRLYAHAHRATSFSPIGEGLRGARRGAGMTLRQVADATKRASAFGLSHTTIHRLEAGLRRPSQRSARLLAQVLELPDELKKDLFKEAKPRRGRDLQSLARRAEWKLGGAIRLGVMQLAARLDREFGRRRKGGRRHFAG